MSDERCEKCGNPDGPLHFCPDTPSGPVEPGAAPTPPEPAEVFPVWVTVREEMDARGWSNHDVARRMGGDFNLNLATLSFLFWADDPDLYLGEETAAQLEVAFGIAKENWLRLDAAWREFKSRRVASASPPLNRDAIRQAALSLKVMLDPGPMNEPGMALALVNQILELAR